MVTVLIKRNLPDARFSIYIHCSTFSTNCHNIEKLILHKCYRLTDTAVEALSQNCPKLLYLDLSSCRAISDKSCQYLA